MPLAVSAREAEEQERKEGTEQSSRGPWDGGPSETQWCPGQGLWGDSCWLGLPSSPCPGLVPAAHACLLLGNFATGTISSLAFRLP